jgi:hypothetical protein
VNNGSDVFISLLTVLFIGLKLTGYIDWSWWWVLSPIWIPIAIILIVSIIWFAVVFVLDRIN